MMRKTLEAVDNNSNPNDENLDNRRPVTGRMVRTRQQLKYAVILVCGGIIAQSVIIATVVYFMSRSILSITEIYHLDPEVGSSITSSITNSLVLIMLVATAVAMAAILIGLRLSHRVYGPMIPFRRHIEELKKGNFAARIRLRKDDDLLEIRDALNDLAITLEDRFKGR